jgi:hypothetical protein
MLHPSLPIEKNREQLKPLSFLSQWQSFPRGQQSSPVIRFITFAIALAAAKLAVAGLFSFRTKAALLKFAIDESITGD